MGVRVFFGDFLIRLGRFVQSLAIMVMREDDLVEFSRRTYSRPAAMNTFGRSNVDSGLFPDEEALAKMIPLKSGRLLLLGVGGGREAIPFARMGFQVTGVDFVPEMVHKAIENAARHGYEINGLGQEISNLDVESSSYDVVWLSLSMYSSIPTRRRRVEMLKRINKALKPGGYFICQFQFGMRQQFTPRVEFAKKLIAYLTLGYIDYETGDILLHNIEFVHVFSTENELMSEFNEGGFEIISIQIKEDDIRGGALLRRKDDS